MRSSSKWNLGRLWVVGGWCDWVLSIVVMVDLMNYSVTGDSASCYLCYACKRNLNAKEVSDLWSARNATVSVRRMSAHAGTSKVKRPFLWQKMAVIRPSITVWQFWGTLRVIVSIFLKCSSLNSIGSFKSFDS